MSRFDFFIGRPPKTPSLSEGDKKILQVLSDTGGWECHEILVESQMGGILVCQSRISPSKFWG